MLCEYHKAFCWVQLLQPGRETLRSSLVEDGLGSIVYQLRPIDLEGLKENSLKLHEAIFKLKRELAEKLLWFGGSAMSVKQVVKSGFPRNSMTLDQLAADPERDCQH